MKLPRWFPAAAAAVLAVVVAAAVAQAASTGDLTAARLAGGLAIVPCAVATGRFADRRAGVAIGVIVAPLVALLTGLTSASAGWFVLVVFTGQAGSTMTFRRGATIYGAALAAILVGAVVQPDQGWVSWGIGTSFGFWGAWAARSRIEALELERTTALAAERQRLAHDLHDVVAHTLAVTVLHLGGARLAVAHEPEAALAAIAEAERLARESMAQLRSIVSVLADDEPDGRARPQPEAEDVLDLLDEYRDAGLKLGTSIEGDLASVPSPKGMVLYRIAQEALANAARHAPNQPVTLNLDVRGGRVHLDVRNSTNGHAPTANGRGMGVASMTDRARAIGGALAAGPNDGGWVVQADL